MTFKELTGYKNLQAVEACFGSGLAKRCFGCLVACNLVKYQLVDTDVDRSLQPSFVSAKSTHARRQHLHLSSYHLHRVRTDGSPPVFQTDVSDWKRHIYERVVAVYACSEGLQSSQSNVIVIPFQAFER